MSRFLHTRYAGLETYTPGEQPRDKQYIKLNTNESPYPPSPEVLAALGPGEVADLRLYSDPEGAGLREKLAGLYGVTPGQVFLSNGSDDILNFAFMAFGEKGAVFPSLTYSFYPVFANLHQVPYETVPLREDFSVDVAALPLDQVEALVASNPGHVVVVDEAYVDFGAASAAALLGRYENLLVVMTYSKSRSMAGARLGFALGSRELIADLERLKYATNPYNVNRLTLRLGEAAVDSDPYFRANARRIMATRDKTARALREMGFRLPDSQANFLFVTHPRIDGARLYQKCRERGILIRHFSDPAIAQYNRVTIGAEEEMETFLTMVRDILREEGL